MGSSERCKIHIAGLFYLITLLYLTTLIVKYIKRAVGHIYVKIIKTDNIRLNKL